uniref:hypothetical protein n=1 Tax=Herbidospora sakaeratensis TaxID=564415 RepID=UPI000B07CBA8|nr:hypothetical protein [Herbidospora sakaeratensis]
MTPDLSALDRLTALVPPPATPRHRDALSWDEFFAVLGIRLPADYVAFMDRYGECQFANWLGIADPRRDTPEECDFLARRMKG